MKNDELVVTVMELKRLADKLMVATAMANDAAQTAMAQNAVAWDEGYLQGHTQATFKSAEHPVTRVTNPYRKDNDA